MTIFTDEKIAAFIETKFPELNLKAKDGMGFAAFPYFQGLAAGISKPGGLDVRDREYNERQLVAFFEPIAVPIDGSKPMISFDDLVNEFTNFAQISQNNEISQFLLKSENRILHAGTFAVVGGNRLTDPDACSALQTIQGLLNELPHLAASQEGIRRIEEAIAVSAAPPNLTPNNPYYLEEVRGLMREYAVHKGDTQLIDAMDARITEASRTTIAEPSLAATHTPPLVVKR